MRVGMGFVMFYLFVSEEAGMRQIRGRDSNGSKANLYQRLWKFSGDDGEG